MCRFYLFLAGAPEDEGEGLCGAPLLHPLDSTSSPRRNPLRRGISAAAVDRDLGFRYPVQVDNPQFRIWFGYLCSGCDRSRFSRGVGLVSFVFHYWGDGLFVPAATVGWAMVYRWICADREWSVNMEDNGEGKPVNVVPSPIWYGLLQLYRKLYPAVASNRRRMTPY